MAIKISQLPEETVVTDNDVVAVVDVESTTTKKSKVSNFFNWLLGRANTWTKSQTIITDGATTPLVVRNSTNTADDFKVLNKSAWATGGGNVTSNTAYGPDALRNNTTGNGNIANGSSALFNNTTGSSNSANGLYALYGNTNGGANSAHGARALQAAVGSNNTSQGYASGYYIADGVTPMTTANQSLFLGAYTKSLANNQTNEIVIGYNAIGKGSNSVVLGNDSIVNTWLKGVVNLVKQLRIVSDGTNSPLVVRDSTDTVTDFQVLNKSAWASGGGNLAGNCAYGSNALLLNTTGYGVTATGSNALRNNTTGINNTAYGAAAFLNLNNGSNNLADGVDSGRYLADGTTALTQANQSLFLGAYTKSLANGQTNEIVIGYNAIGKGSNTVVLGNDSILNTWLKGVVNLVKQLRIVSDGTNSPLVVRDSTDTVTKLSIDTNGALIDMNNVYANSSTPTIYQRTNALRLFDNGVSSGATGFGITTQNVATFHITTYLNMEFRTYESSGYAHFNTKNVLIRDNTANASTPPNSSAKLQVDSTTQGFLPPRMTTTQRNAIATPAEGLMVYDTTVKGWFGYDGTNWIQL